MNELGFPADVDGFKLLEQIGLELDVPVISKHGASLFKVASSILVYCVE